ncbi:MAG: hypothetical protein D6722_26095 [Bacteroidetes bacterium]|nr:MAG: hypothetical protein D6722_26095 [Bacteroidota bacterium]
MARLPAFSSCGRWPYPSLVGLLLLLPWLGITQPTAVVVRDISLSGADKTRDWVILRELTFTEGDTLLSDKLNSELARSEQNIYNLGLFTDVTLTPRQDSGQLWLHIQVQERWYLLGTPALDLEERNAYDRLGAVQRLDLHRLSYGLSINWRNLTGRNETLNVLGQVGFSQRLRVDWLQPRVWPHRNLDLYASLVYTREGEIIAGIETGQVQWRSLEDRPMRRRFRASVGLSRRLDPYRQLYAELGYRHERYADSLQRLRLRGEPLGFVPDGGVEVVYPQLTWGYVVDRRDVRAFPLRGYKLHLFGLAAGPAHRGGAEFVHLGATWAHHLRLGTRWYWAYGLQQINILGQQVPWFARTFVGISETPFRGVSTELRGYEPYALAATWLSLAKTEFKFALLPRRIVHLSWLPSRRFQDLPVGVYLSTFVEGAYVRDQSFQAQDPFLLEQPLLGYGLGLNLIGFYDMLVRVEYSRNHLGRGGVYLHGTVPIK